MTKLPDKLWLPRGDVARAVGGRRALERFEAEQRLTRRYPAGHKRARYARGEVQRLLDDLSGRVS